MKLHVINNACGALTFGKKSAECFLYCVLLRHLALVVFVVKVIITRNSNNFYYFYLYCKCPDCYHPYFAILQVDLAKHVEATVCRSRSFRLSPLSSSVSQALDLT